MKTILNFTIIAFSCIVLNNCAEEQQQVTIKEDYQAYLNMAESISIKEAKEDHKFWTEKFEKAPSQFPFLVKIASAETELFNVSGRIEHLKNAEATLIQLNEKTNYSNASHLRSLARNYISQHQFKNALNILLKAEINGKNLKATQCMLFDVHLELGNEIKAEQYLKAIKNFSDFDYLIRLSKYNDHKGNLDAAINFLEKAKGIADASNLRGTKQWVYTNLADYYGHAGRIEDSYKHYLKALELDANDAYAKKGIAWIVYSHERNPEEALRILESISKTHASPDYALLKSEILDFLGKKEDATSEMNLFENKIANTLYGDMYNADKIELWSEDLNKQEDAIKLAEIEVENRPTAQTYDLLAWSYFKSGDVDKAHDIVQKHVKGKTFEPVAQYHMAEILKAIGRRSESTELKQEVLTAIYELGPHLEEKIKRI